MRKSSKRLTGVLYLCATPIGNMRDVTLRVLDTLGQADVVACEDTRRTRKLLSVYGISKPLLTYSEDNRERAGKRIIRMLEDGKNVALVSDAGMPGISDPGSHLVSECINRGIEVSVVPGANAALAALVLSGLPTGRFVFEGFLPRKRSAKMRRLREIAGEGRTIVFYESPLRFRQTLEDMLEAFGDRRIAVARELTKKFETVLRGSISKLLEEAGNLPEKGEFVIVVAGATGGREKSETGEELARVQKLLGEGYSLSESVRIVAALSRGVSKRELYDLAIRKLKPPEAT